MLSGMTNYPPYPQQPPPFPPQPQSSPQQSPPSQQQAPPPKQSEPASGASASGPKGRRINWSTFSICVCILIAGLYVGNNAKHPVLPKPARPLGPGQMTSPQMYPVGTGQDYEGMCWYNEAGISCYPTP